MLQALFFILNGNDPCGDNQDALTTILSFGRLGCDADVGAGHHHKLSTNILALCNLLC